MTDAMRDAVSSHPLLRSFEDRPKDFDVVGFGENSIDQLCVLQRDFRMGDKQSLADWHEEAGGQVAGALLGCARLGLRAAYVGSVGDDAAGRRVLRPLVDAGVDVSGVRTIEGARTRRAIIVVRPSDGERSVLAHRDPRLALPPERLEAHEIERGRLLHLDTTDVDASFWAAGVAREAGIPVVLDADALWSEPERLLKRVDFPVVTGQLAEEFGEGGSRASGLRRLVGWGARLAVATCGAGGAHACSDAGDFRLPSFEVAVKDTTGAGDAFRAGFIWGLLNGHEAERVVRAANAVGALGCTKRGAQRGLPSREEVDALMERSPRREGEVEKKAEKKAEGGER